jgi:molybdopterin-containing oxidoreductase family iron-sulfur binding subunit
MDKSRRQFLKLAGGAVLLAAGGKLATNAIASGAPHAATAPKTGKQWAMVVDLQKLAGKDVSHLAAACHKAHNVPDFGNKKDEVKWFWDAPFAHTFPETAHFYPPLYVRDKKVPVLCNHCANPPCVRACPTKATYQTKDGIVAMDFHRCIGCRFCVSACPYGARSLNFFDPRTVIKEPYNREFPTRTKGVVEKCNFCVERLAKGLQPACVEACTDNELIFGDLNDAHSAVRQVLDQRFSIVRKPGLGTQPKVFYIV